MADPAEATATVAAADGKTTIATEVPKGWWKRRRQRMASSPPPVVVEIRIDVNQKDAEEPEPQPALPAAQPVAHAMEMVVKGDVDPEAFGWIGKIGGALRDRLDEVVGTAGAIVESRIEAALASANAQIDDLVEDTVNSAMDTVIHKVLEERLTELTGVTIDLTRLEDTAAPAPEQVTDAPASRPQS